MASRKGPRYGYRGSNPPTTSWSAGEVPSFPVPILARPQCWWNQGLPPPQKRKCLCAHSAERRGGDVCQAQGWEVTSGARWPCAPQPLAWGCPRLWRTWWVVSVPSGRSQRALPRKRPQPPASRSSPPGERNRAQSLDLEEGRLGNRGA